MNWWLVLVIIGVIFIGGKLIYDNYGQQFAAILQGSGQKPNPNAVNSNSPTPGQSPPYSG